MIDLENLKQVARQKTEDELTCAALIGLLSAWDISAHSGRLYDEKLLAYHVFEIVDAMMKERDQRHGLSL